MNNSTRGGGGGGGGGIEIRKCSLAITTLATVFVKLDPDSYALGSTNRF